MTKYHELKTYDRTSRKRVGRGISAGQGKTAGRGTKGQNARAGKKIRATFMGGQLPLVEAVPKKRGFKSLRIPAQVVYSDELNRFDGKVVDNTALFEAGLVVTPYHRVKVITRGELTAKIDLKVQAASKGVQEQVQKNGGTFEKNPVPLVQNSTPETAE